MQFNKLNFNLDSSESWLILLIYAGFWLYSYYSLVICLIHTHKQQRIAENLELEESSLDAL
ncbi:hypothetical protein [Pleurocapsa sp. PCC 7319]|uniref:hypothetical protein n=1 Tax=Pleurocapsa sp. PCC 7319 TaxID=118161 RepID=UPI00034D4E27|nr:hypothetical protein [Pleurocapsa sp. PCC 7319]